MLKKENRIRTQKEFDQFFGRNFKMAKGINFSGAFMFVKVLPSTRKVSRIGFMVNNKVDKRATERNKIKRRLREVVRLNLAGLRGKSDVLIVANSKIVGKTYKEIEAVVVDLLKKAKVL
jgi:ribonuclease P protein component